jgi:hypothetical protein
MLKPFGASLASHHAHALLQHKYGMRFAGALMEYISGHREPPGEDFADFYWERAPDIFCEAWNGRLDLTGRKIGDHVDVTHDAVTDLWDQYQATL